MVLIILVTLLFVLHTSSGAVTRTEGCDDLVDSGCYDETLRFCFYNTKREISCPVNYFCSCDGKECVKGKKCQEPSYKPCDTPGLKIPSFTDCSTYYVCTKTKNATMYVKKKCISHMVYDLKKNLCVKSSKSIGCLKVNCPASRKIEPVNVPLANPKYYVRCLAGIGEVRMCNGSQVMDLNSQTCGFNCVEEGYFKDTDVCGKYYTCELIGGLLYLTENYCEEGTDFNEKEQVCEGDCGKEENKPEEEDEEEVEEGEENDE